MTCSITGCKQPLFIINQVRQGKPIGLKYKVCTKHWTKLYGRGKAIGDKTLSKQGYLVVKGSDGQWRGEHRLIMEKLLGRDLASNESVHHKDGNRSNNSPSNLELWVGAVRYGQRATDLTCPHCKMAYYEPF